MLALVFDGSIALHHRAAPVPGPNEALVRVLRAGICNTDLEIARGYMGFRGVLGHEFVGEVLDAPDRTLIGQRVSAEINFGCGVCSACQSQWSRHCPNRTVLGILGRDGCFAEVVAVPQEALHVVPDAVSNELAVFVEPLAAAFEILEQVHVEPAAKVLVLGDGKLGLLIAMVLQRTGCDLTVAGRHQRKLALARATGVDAVPLSNLRRRDFDLVVEATGSQAGLAEAVSRVRPRGTIVLKSTYSAEAGAPGFDMARLVIDEITLVGSRCGPFGAALRALANGAVDPRPLVDVVLPLDRGGEAFSLAQSPGALKVVLDMM